MGYISILFAVFLLLGCATDDQQGKYRDKSGSYWADPVHAQTINAMIEARESMDYWESRRAELQDEYKQKLMEVNKQVTEYNVSCQLFLRSLSDKQLELYSNLVNSEKAENPPQIELARRHFHSSLTDEDINELELLSDHLQSINIDSEKLTKITLELENAKEELLAASKKADDIRYFGLNYKSNTYVQKSYSTLNAVSDSLREWEQSIRQQNVQYNQNVHMMRMNDSLSDIANSLNSLRRY